MKILDSLTSLRAKLIAVFGILIGLFILVGFFLVRIQNRKQQLLRQRAQLESLHRGVITTLKVGQDFLLYETINPDYFRKRTSKYLIQHDTLLKEVSTQAENLKKTSALDDDLNTEVASIHRLVGEYDRIFHQVEELIQQRGFKDYGLEGRMRDYVHRLENSPQVDRSLVLNIRRHEKDYFLRLDSTYANDVARETQSLVTSLRSRGADSLAYAAEQYLSLFRQLVAIDYQVGYKTNTGLSLQLRSVVEKLEVQIRLVQEMSQVFEAEYARQTNLFLFALIILSLSVGGYFSVYFATYLTKPIHKLEKQIGEIIRSDFRGFSPIKELGSRDEVADLTRSFNVLGERIVSDFQIIRRKNGEMQRLYDELTDNIKTAQLIQQSILPSANTLNQIFSENFVLYMPKDIVSGDFYWATDKYDTRMIAAVDCTGHGVAGAFMTFIGYGALNEIVDTPGVPLRAGDIVNRLNRSVVQALSQKNPDQAHKDGMDISLICYDPDLGVLHYAGAQQPLILVRNGELTQIKGSKYSIGQARKGESKVFENHSFQVFPGDMIYLYSDGYADQIGGPKGDEKFKNFRLRDLFTNIATENLTLQKEILHDTIQRWIGGNEQLDDILVMGIRIPATLS